MVHIASPLNKIMLAIKGRAKPAADHAKLLEAIDHRAELAKEKAHLRSELHRLHEQVRATEGKRLEAVNRYKGIPEPAASQTEQTRKDLEQRRAVALEEMEAIAQEKARLRDSQEQTQARMNDLESELAQPLNVSPEQAAHHRRLLTATQAKANEVKSALASAEAELTALSQAPDPAAELRTELQAALAGQVVGTHTGDDVAQAEARLTAAEATQASEQAGKVARLMATKTGLATLLSELQAEQQRLAAAWPAIAAGAYQRELTPAVAEYKVRLAELVSAWDAVRALRQLAENSGVALSVDVPEVVASLKDAGQLRLAAAMDDARARLAI